MLFCAVSAALTLGGEVLQRADADTIASDPIVSIAQGTLAALSQDRFASQPSLAPPVVAGTLYGSDAVAAFDLLAASIATRLDIDAKMLSATWQRTDPRRIRVVMAALSQIGVPYRYGGNTPTGFDCSGLTSYAWATVGVRIPRTSTDQIAATVPRALDGVQPGDLVWRPGHIGMVLGIDDIMVNATQTGRPVEVKRWGRIVRAGSPIGA